MIFFNLNNTYPIYHFKALFIFMSHNFHNGQSVLELWIDAEVFINPKLIDNRNVSGITTIIGLIFWSKVKGWIISWSVELLGKINLRLDPW